MQTIIRKSVFETNSSSCHSLCIKKGDIGKIVIPEGTLFNNKDGVLTFELGCYGFGSYNLPNFNKKFSYLMTYLLMSMSNAVKELELVFTAVHEVVPFTKAMLFSEKLKDDVWETQKLTIASFDETTNKIQIHLHNLKVIKDNFESYDYYIDHESIGLLSPILSDLRNNNSSSLKRLLFVDESYIHIDDNKENIRYADGGFDEVKAQMHKLFKSLNPSWNTDALVNLFNGKKDLTYLFLDLHSMWKANNEQALNILSSKITSVIYDNYDLYITDYYEEQKPKTYEQFLFEFIEQLFQKQVAQEDKDFLTNGKTILSLMAGDNKSCVSDFFETDFGKYLDKQFIQMVQDEKRHFNEHNDPKDKYPFPFRTSEYGELALKTSIDETTTKLIKEARESESIRTCYQKWLKTLINTDGTFNDSMIMDYLILQNVDKQFDIQKWIDGCDYQYFR